MRNKCLYIVLLVFLLALCGCAESDRKEFSGRSGNYYYELLIKYMPEEKAVYRLKIKPIDEVMFVNCIKNIVNNKLAESKATYDKYKNVDCSRIDSFFEKKICNLMHIPNKNANFTYTPETVMVDVFCEIIYYDSDDFKLGETRDGYKFYYENIEDYKNKYTVMEGDFFIEKSYFSKIKKASFVIRP